MKDWATATTFRNFLKAWAQLLHRRFNRNRKCREKIRQHLWKGIVPVTFPQMPTDLLISSVFQHLHLFLIKIFIYCSSSTLVPVMATAWYSHMSTCSPSSSPHFLDTYIKSQALPKLAISHILCPFSLMSSFFCLLHSFMKCPLPSKVVVGFHLAAKCH